MTQKELLILVLTKLIPYWDLAEDFLVLVKGTEDSGFIQELYLLITTQISSIQNEQQKQILLDQIQKIKTTKLHQEECLEKERDEADSMLDNFISDIL